jgi:hypothetical protein
MHGLIVGGITAVILSICAFISQIPVKPKEITVVDNLHDQPAS